jgi:hypothetical protein
MFGEIKAAFHGDRQQEFFEVLSNKAFGLFGSSLAHYYISCTFRFSRLISQIAGFYCSRIHRLPRLPGDIY